MQVRKVILYSGINKNIVYKYVLNKDIFNEISVRMILIFFTEAETRNLWDVISCTLE